MLGFRLFDECGQDKGSIDSTASLSKAKLIRPKHALLLCYPGHGVSHPHGQEPQDVGGDRNGTVLAHGQGVPTLKMFEFVKC